MIQINYLLIPWGTRNLKEDDQSAVIGDIFQKAWDREAKKTKKYVQHIKRMNAIMTLIIKSH